ncbi:MAG: WGR domain-containing protein [Myxococcota bacterium]
MPRYEFQEGTSNKFWEITLDGKSFKTTFGKIGTAGQTSEKSFGDEGAAKAAYEKLITEKTKKGYKLVSDGAAAPASAPAAKKEKAAPAGTVTLDARNPELEAAILKDPTDRQAFSILADWLQDQGDPRGELISLQLANKEGQAKKLIEEKADYFLGPLAEHQEVHDEGYNNSRSHLRTRAQEEAWQKVHKQAFLWRNGYIYRVRLSHDSYSDEGFKGKTVDILRDVLEHPSARFAVEFAFQSNGDPNEDDLQDLIDLLGEKAPPTTRKITFGDNVDQISWHHTGSLAKLWKGVPHLRTLEIETGEFEVGKMDAPALERAIFITGGLSQSCGKDIATAKMPNIKHLEIYYGTEEYGGTCGVDEVRPLLERTDLKHLEYLGLKNSEFADDIAGALAGAKVLKGLKTLDLSLGTMSDAGAKALANAKPYLEHLECLDLTRNYLTKEGIALVKGLCKKVITADQEEADEGDDSRYAAIRE